MKPSPIASAHVCSACGLDWKRHGDKPSLSKCVELLKADLTRARRPSYEATGVYPITKATWKEANV